MANKKQQDERQYLDGSLTKVKALDDKGTFEGIVATNAVDRHGEVINIMGIDTTTYMSTNPIVLFGHDYWNAESVIGKALTLSKTKGGQLLSKFELFVDDNPKAALVAKLIKKGVCSLSIGFVPKEIEGDEYTKSEMVEYSVVPVPANGQAAITARSLASKGFTQKEIGFFKELVKDMEANAVEEVETKGAVQDELNEEAMWEKKAAYMRAVYDVFWAFTDVYYSQDTAVEDFNKLLTETIGLFQQIVDGTFDPDGDGDNDADPNGDTDGDYAGDDDDEILEYSVSNALKNVDRETVDKFFATIGKSIDANTTTEKGIADDGDVTAMQNLIQTLTQYLDSSDDAHSKMRDALQALAGGSDDAEEAEEEQSGTDHDATASNTVKEAEVTTKDVEAEEVKEAEVEGEEEAGTEETEEVVENVEKSVDISNMKPDNLLQLAKMLTDLAVVVQEKAQEANSHDTTGEQTHSIVRKRRVVLREAKKSAKKADKVVEMVLSELKNIK